MNTQTTTTDYRTPTPNTVEFKVDIRFHTDDIDILFAGRDTTRHPRFIPRYTVVARELNNIHMEMLADNPFAENVLIELDIRLAQLVGIGQRRIERCQEIAAQAEEEEGRPGRGRGRPVGPTDGAPATVRVRADRDV